jgi:transposase
MSRRSTQDELIMLKKNILDQLVAKEINRSEAAKRLSMHPNAVSRLKTRYEEEGEASLMPAKPGPKPGGIPYNRTKEELEDTIVALAIKQPYEGPVGIQDRLLDEYGIKLDSVTVWRILKRRNIRYGREYKEQKKEYTLYCLDKPGKQLQMDGMYPFGKMRNIVQFDAIDDCSRFIYARLYTREDAASAIDFVSHLVQRAPFPIESIRVDNRYGKRFESFCQTLDIEVIKNDPHTPKQNGKIERFHKTAKREFYWRHCDFHDPKELLAYKLSLWLSHYNHHRRHGGYGMDRQTPVQKLTKTLLHSLPYHYPQNVTGTLQQYMT